MHMHPLSKDEVDRILDNNLVDEFDRLAGTPGYVLVPMPFQKVYRAVSPPVRHQQYLSLPTDQPE